jgi:hypothetical protein
MATELRPSEVAPATAVPAISVLAAWVFLAVSDALLKGGGFDRFYRAVGRCPTIVRTSRDHRRVLAGQWCAAVERARAWYVRRAWCLQAAGAAVMLLRLRGVDAQLVIGVRKMPFLAHAWVELDGEVLLNDERHLRRMYRELVRC